MRWIRLKSPTSQDVVFNLAHCVRIDMGSESASVLVLREGQLVSAGTTRDPKVLTELRDLVEGSPDAWLAVQGRDSTVPGDGWVNLLMVARATIAANRVELLGPDGSWVGTASDPHQVMLVRQALGT